MIVEVSQTQWSMEVSIELQGCNFYRLVGGMVTLLAAKEVIQTLVVYKSMAADQRALAAIEIDMNAVPEGQVINFGRF
jgi:hypothetical protein